MNRPTRARTSPLGYPYCGNGCRQDRRTCTLHSGRVTYAQNRDATLFGLLLNGKATPDRACACGFVDGHAPHCPTSQRVSPRTLEQQQPQARVEPPQPEAPKVEERRERAGWSKLDEYNGKPEYMLGKRNHHVFWGLGGEWTAGYCLPHAITMHGEDLDAAMRAVEQHCQKHHGAAPAQPQAPKAVERREFRVGDVVRCINANGTECDIQLGDTYQVVADVREHPFAGAGATVELRGVKGWFYERRFELATGPAPEQPAGEVVPGPVGMWVLTERGAGSYEHWTLDGHRYDKHRWGVYGFADEGTVFLNGVSQDSPRLPREEAKRYVEQQLAAHERRQVAK